MRCALLLGLLLSIASLLPAQNAGEPTVPEAQKVFAEAQTLEKQHRWQFAMDGYRKAAKLDINCTVCLEKTVDLAAGIKDWKAADAASAELLARAKTNQAQAEAHNLRAKYLLAWAKHKRKPEAFAAAASEADAALGVEPENRTASYLKGEALAEEGQDEAAKQIFTALLPRLKPDTVERERVARYAARPDLVRARLAPAFSVLTVDGKRVSLDNLQGKVVLLDFWATWCGPCREALPHIQRISREFAGQPLVVLSISLDRDENQWKEFLAKNNMDWMQSRDGYFNGPVAQLFQVNAIPHTFVIDSDGVLQDEHIGDASLEGKLRKLIARAQEQNSAASKETTVSGQ